MRGRLGQVAGPTFGTGKIRAVQNKPFALFAVGGPRGQALLEIAKTIEEE